MSHAGCHRAGLIALNDDGPTQIKTEAYDMSRLQVTIEVTVAPGEFPSFIPSFAFFLFIISPSLDLLCVPPQSH